MRTKRLLVSGEYKEGVLMAGGYGAKVYSVEGNALVLQVGRKNVILDGDAYNDVMDYVNVEYMNESQREGIVERYREIVGKV